MFIVTIDSADGSEDESNRNIGLSIDLEMAVLELDDEDPPVEVTIGFFPPSDGFDAADDACIAWSMAWFSPWDDSTSSIDDDFSLFRYNRIKIQRHRSNVTTLPMSKLFYSYSRASPDSQG